MMLLQISLFLCYLCLHCHLTSIVDADSDPSLPIHNTSENFSHVSLPFTLSNRDPDPSNLLTSVITALLFVFIYSSPLLFMQNLTFHITKDSSRILKAQNTLKFWFCAQISQMASHLKMIAKILTTTFLT